MEFYAAGRKKELFSDVQGPMFVAMPVLVSEMFFLCHQPTHLLLSLGPWGSCPNSFPFSSSKHLPLANIVITLVPSNDLSSILINQLIIIALYPLTVKVSMKFSLPLGNE